MTDCLISPDTVLTPDTLVYPDGLCPPDLGQSSWSPIIANPRPDMRRGLTLMKAYSSAIWRVFLEGPLLRQGRPNIP